MLSGSLAQPCSLARHPVPALLEAFRLLLPDLEKTSGTDPLAGLFQVRHAASHAGERSVYRKSDLTAFARNDQISASYIWTYSGAFSHPLKGRDFELNRECAATATAAPQLVEQPATHQYSE